MNWPGDEWLEGLALFLAKGAGWLLLCGLIGWKWPRLGLSTKAALTGLVLLSAAGLLPAVWMWTLPVSEPETAATAVIQEPASGAGTSITTANTNKDLEILETAPGTDFSFPFSLTCQEWLGILWLGSTVGLWAWLLTGFATARRWIRGAIPLTDPKWLTILARECAREPALRIPPLLLNPAVPGPCTAGCLRPVILLPACCREWDGETRTLVIRHELAHLRRGDARHAWIRALALVLHWPNPLVWLAVSRSRREEELAADAAVLAHGTSPERYAATLLRVARSCQFSTQSPLVTAMAHTSTLESRIRHLLDGKWSTQSPVRFAAAGMACTLITAGVIGCSSVERASRNADSSELPGAPTPITPIDSEALKGLLASVPSKAKKFTVNFRVIDLSGRDLNTPRFLTLAAADAKILNSSMTLRLGQKGQFQSLREFPQPTKFDPPQWASPDGYRTSSNPNGTSESNGGSYPVQPTTPYDFVGRPVGWKMEDVTVEPERAYLKISGTFHETAFDGFIRNAGEAYSTIITKGTNAFGREEEVVLTDNKVLSPTFTTRETPFKVAALPGKSYRVRLNLKHPDAFLEISCTPEKE